MQLNEQVLPSGRKSLYHLGEDKKEYVYFKSRKQKLIIRDFFLDDAISYYNTISNGANRYTNAIKKNFIKEWTDVISKRDTENDEEYSLLITSVSGKILGAIDVYTIDTGANLRVFINSPQPNIRERVIRAIREMQKEYWWYDELYLSNETETELLGSVEEYM